MTASIKFSLDDAQRARIAALVDQICDFDVAQLDAAALKTGGEPSVDLVLAVLLRAGRPMPPGLSTARRAQRQERTDEALAWLRAALAQPRRATLVGDAISAALRLEEPAPELSVAAMRVVASLDLVAHAQEVALWLEPASAGMAGDAGAAELPRLRSHAQTALFQLYGRWFETGESFQAQWEILRGRSPAGTGRNELLAAIDTADERALRLIEFAPGQLDHDLMAWSSPAMRSAAARAIGRAVAGGTLAPDVARAKLMEGLVDERSERPLAARLQTLLDLIQGADPAGDAAQSVRRLVFDIADSASKRSCEEVWVTIGALTRLVHASGPEGDLPRGETLHRGIQLFTHAFQLGEVRALDPDALQSAISGLCDLVRSIDDGVYAAQAAAPLAQLVRPLVVGAASLSRRERTPLRVRRAAAEAFALSVDPADAKELVSVVRSMETPELEYELLGALRAVIQVVEPGDANAEAVISELFEAAAEPEFDHRARALELLLSSDVRAALLAGRRAKEASWIEARLFAEPSPELRSSLVRLLGLVGTEASLEGLLALPEGDSGEGPGTTSLEQLAASGEEMIPALVDLAKALAVDRPDLQLSAAYALLGEESLVGSTDPLRPLRVRAGLDLLLAADLAGLADPDAVEAAERRIVRAALQLRLLRTTAITAFFVSSMPSALRLREIVEARAAGAMDAGSNAEPNDESGLGMASFESLLASALLRSDLMRAAASAGVQPTSAAAQDQSIGEVLKKFDRVLVGAPIQGWERPVILLESVAFLRALQRPGRAIPRLEQLVLATPLPDASELSSETIRLYSALLLSPETESIRTAGRIGRAARLYMNLLTRPSWQVMPVEERLRDLEWLVDLRTLAAGNDVLAPVIDEVLMGLAADEALREELSAADAERTSVLWTALPESATPDDPPADSSPDREDDPGGDDAGSSAPR